MGGPHRPPFGSRWSERGEFLQHMVDSRPLSKRSAVGWLNAGTRCSVYCRSGNEAEKPEYLGMRLVHLPAVQAKRSRL